MSRIAWIISSYFLLLAMGLSGCKTITPTSSAPPLSSKNREIVLNQIQQWQLNGKIGVQTAQDSGSANLTWIENQHHYTISLSGPLGTGNVKLTGQPGLVTMETSDGKQLTAQNPEQLLAKWGWNIPVSNLYYWIRGLPHPGKPFQGQYDEYHRLSALNQESFQVQFLSYVNTGTIDLPNKLYITSPTLKTKIVVHDWDIK